MTILPSTIPIFPLFNAVLFPSVFLPLHIFEPRYRAMVADALRGDRIIGLVLLRPGWEQDSTGDRTYTRSAAPGASPRSSSTASRSTWSSI